MATLSHTQIFDQTQQTARRGVNAPFARRLRFAGAHATCRTAADVRSRAAIVLAWRARSAWTQRPSAPPGPPPAARAANWPVSIAQICAVAAEPVADQVELSVPPSATPTRITVRAVLAATAAHFGIKVAEIEGHSRKQPLVRRRQIAAALAKRLTGRSLPFIGSLIGGRDHTTILHAVRTIDALIAAGDAATIAAVDAITLSLIGGAA